MKLPAPHGAFERIDEHHSHVRGQDDGTPGAPALITRTRTMRYVSVHHHSTFSFLDGYGLPKAHVRRGAELGMEYLGLTEHGNVSSHVKLEQACQEHGLGALFGVELYTGGVGDAATQRKNHLTVLASSDEGYRNVLRLVSRGWAEGFYYEPTVSAPMLAEHKEGLVILSGCQGSLLATSLVGGKTVDPRNAGFGRARRVAEGFRNELGDQYYLEVQAFPELPKSCEINQAYERLSNELGIPLVATGDVHYTMPSESEMQEILHNVRGMHKQTQEDQARNWGYDVPLSPPTTDKVMYDRLRGTGLSHHAAVRAIYNAQEVAQRCSGVTLPKLPPLRFPLPAGVENTKTYWLEQLKQGWKYRGMDKLPHEQRLRYMKQLKYERSIIEEKDYVDYFLVIADLVVFAKTVGIPVGPARGSAAASLACYLLRITEVDPLQYPNLVFERFIDLTRQDLPDVDLDFDDERRREIRDYLVAKYGAACVGNIGSFTTYKSKLALDDVARVHRIPQWEVDGVKDLLIERSSGDLRADATIEDTVEYFEKAAEIMDRHPELRKAMDLEGQYKGLGVHAAGLVVANGPLTNACAVYVRSIGKKKIPTEIVSVDKYDAEHLNILKMDLLGLNTMGMIRRCLEEIGMKLEELYALPFDDPVVIDGFRRNDVVGVFQFDGRAMRSVNGELQPDTFAEICDVNALARPGPLHSGATSEYVDAKRGRKDPVRLHPMLDAICASTHYQIVYQEQILRTVREIGDFDWTHAAYIRKIISKKIGEQEFNRQWDRFWTGAQTHDIDEPTARAIWNTCITAGAYAFNAAHCVSYGMIAYWTMWLKQYHPRAFYAAALTKYDKKKLELLRDAHAHGIEILPPDPRRSLLDWSVEDEAIRGGLTEVEGIADTVAGAILAYRDDVGIATPADILNIKGIGPAKVAACERMLASDDPYGIHAMGRAIAATKEEILSGALGRVPRPSHTAVEVPYSKDEQNTEVVWLGYITNRNLRDLFELHYSRTGEQLDPSTVSDPELREYVSMNGQDDTEMLTVAVDRWKYPALRDAVWGIKLNHDLVLVRGVKKGYQARRAIYVHQMWVIDPEDDEEDVE